MNRVISDAESFWQQVDRTGDCWLWKRSVCSIGYGEFRMFGKRYMAHRFAYELTHGPIPSGAFVCHTCDNPTCCNPAHLWLGTQIDNMRDCARKGRCHPRKKISDDQVRKIKQLRAGGASCETLARMFGVGREHIRRIALGLRRCNIAREV